MTKYPNNATKVTASIGKALLSLAISTGLLGTFSTEAYAQEVTPPSKLGLTIKPQSFIVGANVGVDYALTSRVALAAEVTTHLWLVPRNIAFTPSIKYVFLGNTEKGLYTRAKLVGGYFFKETPYNEHPYYAGGGIGVGGTMALNKSGSVSLFSDVGAKFAAPFGKREGSLIKDTNWGIAYYSMLSPASLCEFSIGLRFRL